MILSKHLGPALGTPSPTLLLSLPRPGPWTCRPSPPPCPAPIPSPWKLEILARPGPLGSEGTLSPGRGPAPGPSGPAFQVSDPHLPLGEALAGLPDTLSLLHYCGPLGSSAMMKGHQSGPAHHPQCLGGGGESCCLTPLTSSKAQVRSWSGLSIGGSGEGRAGRSSANLSIWVMAGQGEGAEASDSEKLWFEEDLYNQLPGKPVGLRFGQGPVEKEAHCFARRVCPGLAQSQLNNLDSVEVPWAQPSWKAWGGPNSGENVLLGSQQEQH